MDACLVGGPGDGTKVPMAMNTVRYAVYNPTVDVVTEVLYTAQRAVSPYPIPGWDLEIVEDLARGPRESDAWWKAAIWALPDRHQEIAEYFDRVLNPAIGLVYFAREWEQSEVAFEQALRKVEAAVDGLIALTTPRQVATMREP